MKRPFAAALAAAVLVLAGPASGAQERAPAGVREVGVGSRVRISAPSIRDEPFTGRITVLAADSMVLDTAGVRRRLGFDTGPVLVDQLRMVMIPRTAVTGVEVFAGRTRRRSTIRAALIGAAAGGVAFGVANLPEINPGFGDFVEGVPVGLAVGGIIGGIIGYALGGERWAPAALPGGVSPR